MAVGDLNFRATRRLLAATAAATSAPAQAHLVETGFGAFYDGFAHVFVTPADLLVVVALALFAGQRGTGTARLTVFALPAAWLLAGLWSGALTMPASAETDLPLLTTLSFGLAGVLVALNARIPAPAIAAFVILAGLIHGYVNGATMVLDRTGVLALVGAVSAVFCLTAIASAQVTTLETGWTRIAVRVGGSWIAAAGLLMVGWIMRAPAGGPL